MTLSSERQARNQTIFREVNQRLREIAHRPSERVTEYLCECSDVACRDTIKLEATAYEAVRSTPNVFVIIPGHDRLEVERVIEDNNRFMLVEKTIPVDDVDLTAVFGNRPWPAAV
jgi:hypothetical protein